MNDDKLIALIKKISDETYNHWILNKTDEDKNSNPKNIKEAFEQCILIIEHIGNLYDNFNQDDIDDLTNHYILVHFEILIWIQKLNITGLDNDAKASLILYAAWAARIGAKLAEMDKIVNVLGEYANQCQDKAELQELAYSSRCIIDAVPKKLIMADDTDDNRPWRVLLLNNGIVATRSEHVEYIEQAYQLISKHLAKDAPSFFAQALKQMENANYPEHVSDRINHYYDLWNDDTKH